MCLRGLEKPIQVSCVYYLMCITYCDTSIKTGWPIGVTIHLLHEYIKCMKLQLSILYPFIQTWFSDMKLTFENHWIKWWGNYRNKPHFHHSITLYFLLGSWHWKILQVLETVAGKNVYASTNTWDWKEVCHWAAGGSWSVGSTFMYLTPYNVIDFTLYECDTNHIIMWFWEFFFW